MNAGDVLLVRTNHLVSRLIRFGQRDYGAEAVWNHVAFVVGPGTIVEALTEGVVVSPSDKYPATDVRVLSPHVWATGEVCTAAMQNNAVDYAWSCVGQSYGWLTILAIAIKALTKGRIDFGISGTSICSGLVARALERTGWNFSPYDPAELTPAYLAGALADWRGR